MTDNAGSGATAETMQTYADLPENVRSHLLELEVFIGDVDGQWTALQTSDENVVLDNGIIDASDAVKAFNGIVNHIRAIPDAAQARIRELQDREAVAKALAVAFHGDEVEWLGFASKADAFIAALTSSARPIPEIGNWPNGCHEPDSCHRHMACMYVQCRRYERDGNENANEIYAGSRKDQSNA